jgi:hypothetical protein
MRIRVQGGTHAGWRKPLGGRPKAWVCECLDPVEGEPCRCGPTVGARWVGDGAFCDECNLEVRPLRLNPGYLARCPDCCSPRPQ